MKKRYLAFAAASLALFISGCEYTVSVKDNSSNAEQDEKQKADVDNLRVLAE